MVASWLQRLLRSCYHYIIFRVCIIYCLVWYTVKLCVSVMDYYLQDFRGFQQWIIVYFYTKTVLILAA